MFSRISYQYIYIAIFFCSVFLPLNAQNRTYQQYIEKYKFVAIKKMTEYKIPASITLAQGILESGAGTSHLARTANNHFGIKCYDGWKGASVYKNDDKKGECFKKYKTVDESFDDHSVFLKRDRYKSLFNLKTTDYKGWANGLQSAGYATDKNYAKKLIELIEMYNLHSYDNPSTISLSTEKTKRNIYKNNGVKFIFALPGDTYISIAQEYNIKIDKLYKYNDATENVPLKIGDIIYLKNKKKKAEKPNFDYVVKSGDSMFSISQKYAVRVESIYKMNKMEFGSSISVGQVLKLR